MTKLFWRNVPLILLAYFTAYMDRVNISFASLQMNDNLKFSASIYGLGAGLYLPRLRDIRSAFQSHASALQCPAMDSTDNDYLGTARHGHDVCANSDAVLRHAFPARRGRAVNRIYMFVRGSLLSAEPVSALLLRL